MICPSCGRPVEESADRYACGCLVVPKTFSGREITPEIARELFMNGVTRELDGFVSRRTGKAFRASLAAEGGRVKLRFDSGRGGPGPGGGAQPRVEVRVCSRTSGAAQVTVRGALYMDVHISYGHVSSRLAECLACLTAAHIAKHALKDVSAVEMSISLNNLDAARYVLRERAPRDAHTRRVLDLLFGVLSGFRNWSARFEPEKRPRLAGSPHSDRFPQGVFPGIDVKVEEAGSDLLITLPEDRPDVQAQFEASLRHARPSGGTTYAMPAKMRAALMAWLSSVKKGGVSPVEARSK